MKHWLFLFVAIVSETIATSALKSSEGFSRLWPSLLVVAGTATNICCESTVRDALMRDFRCFMPHDLVACPTEDGHLAGLRSVMQAFADVRGSGSLTLRG